MQLAVRTDHNEQLLHLFGQQRAPTDVQVAQVARILDQVLERWQREVIDNHLHKTELLQVMVAGVQRLKQFFSLFVVHLAKVDVQLLKLVGKLAFAHLKQKVH